MEVLRETQPLLNERKGHDRTKYLFNYFFITVAALCGFVGFVGTDLFRVAQFTVNEKQETLTEWSCSNYDDDVYLNNVTCKIADETVCDDYCLKCGWCRSLCKSSCDVGSGVVCAMKLLSNMTSTCEMLSSMSSFPPMSETDSNDDTVDSAPETELSGVCDRHSMCEFCTGDCRTIIDINTTSDYGATAVTELCSLPRLCLEWSRR